MTGTDTICKAGSLLQELNCGGSGDRLGLARVMLILLVMLSACFHCAFSGYRLG